jgi:hypothetical protein
MPRIRCHYLDCVFNGDGICSASAVEIDPDAGCMTYSQSNKLITAEWEEEEDELDDDWDELGFEDEAEEEDEEWLDEEEEEDDFEVDDDF